MQKYEAIITVTVADNKSEEAQQCLRDCASQLRKIVGIEGNASVSMKPKYKHMQFTVDAYLKLVELLYNNTEDNTLKEIYDGWMV